MKENKRPIVHGTEQNDSRVKPHTHTRTQLNFDDGIRLMKSWNHQMNFPTTVITSPCKSSNILIFSIEIDWYSNLMSHPMNFINFIHQNGAHRPTFVVLQLPYDNHFGYWSNNNWTIQQIVLLLPSWNFTYKVHKCDYIFYIFYTDRPAKSHLIKSIRTKKTTKWSFLI